MRGRMYYAERQTYNRLPLWRKIIYRLRRLTW